MAYLSTRALIFVWIAITQLEESFASEQAIFKKSEQKYLADHVIEKKQANGEVECGLHCIADKSCTSVNYKTSGIGKGRCELNNRTAEETSDIHDKIHHPEFNYIAVIERVSLCIQLISLSHAMRPGLQIRHFWVAKSLFLTITIHQKKQDKTFCF